MTMAGNSRWILAGAAAAVLLASWGTPALAQAPAQGFTELINAARAHPGCLGVDTGQTASGRRVIFAWFEDKKSLVAWYHAEGHQRAMKRAFPNQSFDREPLPDLPEGSGPILAIVSLKLLEPPPPAGAGLPISSIGIELYTPLPGGVAVGGRFAPDTVKVRGLREIDLTTAQGRSR